MLNCCRLRGDGEYRRTDLRWTTTSWAGPWDTTTRRGSCRRWRARDMFTSLFVILRLCFKFLQDQQLALMATIIRECWSLIQVKAGVSWFLRLKNIFFAQVMVAEAVANVGVTVTTVLSSVMSSTKCTQTTITNITTEPANRRVTGQHLRLRQSRSAWQIIWQPTDTRINNITFRSVSLVCHIWVTNMYVSCLSIAASLDQSLIWWEPVILPRREWRHLADHLTTSTMILTVRSVTSSSWSSSVTSFSWQVSSTSGDDTDTDKTGAATQEAHSDNGPGDSDPFQGFWFYLQFLLCYMSYYILLFIYYYWLQKSKINT